MLSADLAAEAQKTRQFLSHRLSVEVVFTTAVLNWRR